MPPQQNEGPPGTAPRNGPGDASLPMGIIALVASVVPVVGDFVAAPAGLLAVILGAVGVRHSERGVATNFAASLIGATLGALALLIAVLLAAVTR
ncbi:hypothetical protein [Streptomyces aidingensis]|uniref:DUF4190 domain-containing protein n=1 Tax=Streptomyces aidingensis TaxID=910347 RepID=A0A1I1J0E6_9ACTN|nr:hypothetical protein [Streptomyces aidingensis]SFC41432.1 hypothetical protein SAMN05421773_103226 [Streptomyces aidingensis]